MDLDVGVSDDSPYSLVQEKADFVITYPAFNDWESHEVYFQRKEHFSS